MFQRPRQPRKAKTSAPIGRPQDSAPAQRPAPGLTSGLPRVVQRLFEWAPAGALVRCWRPKFLGEIFRPHQQPEDGCANDGRGADLLPGEAKFIVGDISRRYRCHDCCDRSEPPKDGHFRGAGSWAGRQRRPVVLAFHEAAPLLIESTLAATT